MELAFRARKLDHPRSTKVARHTSAQHNGPPLRSQRPRCSTGLLVYPSPRGLPQPGYRSCSFSTNQDEPITVAPVSSRSAPQSTDCLPIQSPPRARISRKTGRLGLHTAPLARLSYNPAASLRTRICRKTGRLGWAPPDQLNHFPSSQLLYGPNYGEKRSDADKVTVSRTRVAPALDPR